MFTRRAKACIFAAIQNSPSPSLLPSLAKSVTHKSASVRIVAAEGALLCLNSLDAPKFDHDTHAHLIEDIINSTTRDASAEVRTVGKEIFEVYKTILPERAARFVSNIPTPDDMSHISFSFIARQDATASRSVSPVRSCSRPTEVLASRSSRKVWWGGPGPKPVVKAVSIRSKQCSTPLGHTVGPTVVPVAVCAHCQSCQFEHAATGCHMRRTTWRPHRQRPFVAPRESLPLPPPVETTSDGDDTIGESVPLTCELFADFR